MGNGINLFGNGQRTGAYYENEGVCKGDLKLLMEKDAEIARLNSEKYADKNSIEVYKYFDDLRAAQNEKWTEQAVINATVNSGINVLNSQVQTVANTLASITKVAVPTSSICNFGCNPCSSNPCSSI